MTTQEIRGNKQIMPGSITDDELGLRFIHGFYLVKSAINDPENLAVEAGKRFLVDASPIGVFVGHTNDIAFWDGEEWHFQSPETGQVIYLVSVETEYKWSGSAWLPWYGKSVVQSQINIDTADYTPTLVSNVVNRFLIDLSGMTADRTFFLPNITQGTDVELVIEYSADFTSPNNYKLFIDSALGQIDGDTSPWKYTMRRQGQSAKFGSVSFGSWVSIASTGVELTILESDDDPIVQGVNKIVFSGASVTDMGDGEVLVAISGGTGGGFTQEEIEDFVGAMVTGNTETGISVTYDDGTGKLNFVAEVTQSELDAVDTLIDNHIADTTDAHDASAISVDDSGFSNITGDDVQTVLADIDSQIDAGGGLAYNAVTVTTGNVTAASGNHYDCTIGGMTANRDFNLPTPSAAGEECAVRVRDGDDTYALIIKANSVEITRLFIAGEFMQFMSYGTGAGDWQVKIDKRIPCLGYAERQATQNVSNNTLTKIALDASVIDQGNIVDVTTNDRINIRRAGRYDLTAFTSIDNLESNDNLQSLIHVNGVEFWRNIMWSSYGASNNAETCQAGPKLYQASVGDYIEVYIKFLEGAAQNTLTGGRSPGLLVKEIL